VFKLILPVVIATMEKAFSAMEDNQHRFEKQDE
jgi:hypothetical protein